MKRGIVSQKGGVWGSDPDGTGLDIVCVRVADFDRTRYLVDLQEPTFRKVTPSERNGRLLAPADLLVEKSGNAGFPVSFDAATKATYSNFLTRLVMGNEHSPRYWLYLLIALHERGVSTAFSNETTMRNLDLGSYLANEVRVPPLDEQRRIAAFLDYETARIDELTQEQKTLANLLVEKQLSTITSAVTRGLQRASAFRDSGVEWIGRVPTHWVVAPIKAYARLESGHTPSRDRPEYWVDCTIPWVSLNDSRQLAAVDYITETAVQINSAGLAGSSARMLPARVVVFTRDATIGLAAITTRPMAVSQHIIAWVCDEHRVLPEYLLLVLYAMKQEFDRYTFGATIRTIGMPDVRKLMAAFPPVAEQADIATAVFAERQRLEALVVEARHLERLLVERRSALITAAVTGQIDVRSWRPPDDWLAPEAA